MKSLSIALIFLYSAQVYAEESKSFQQAADSVHDKLSSIFGRSIAYIDNLVFRDQELIKDTGSRLYLFNQTLYSNDGTVENNTDFRLNLRFPRLSKSLQFSFEGSNRNQNEPNRPSQNIIDNNGSRNQQQPEGVSGAVNYFDQVQSFTRYRISTGVTASTNVKPFIRFLLFREDKYRTYDFRPYFEYSYTHIDGRAQTAGFMFGRQLTNKFALRWFTDQLWSDLEDLVNISIGPSLFQQLSKKRAINYNFRYIYEGRTVMPLKSYEFVIGYRQNLYKEWFYGEGGPFITFARENKFKQSHGAFIKFEVAIGKF